MSVLERLLAGSASHETVRTEGGFVLSPALPGREGLEAFQAVVRDAYAGDGDGYAVYLPHTDAVTGLVDKLVCSLPNEA